jgi:hypothetical protein
MTKCRTWSHPYRISSIKDEYRTAQLVRLQGVALARPRQQSHLGFLLGLREYSGVTWYILLISAEIGEVTVDTMLPTDRQGSGERHDRQSELDGIYGDVHAVNTSYLNYQ